MALSSVSGFMQSLMSWSAGQNLPASSLNLPQASSASQQGKRASFTTGGNTPGGANEVFLFFVTIAPSGSATFSLQNLTDVMQYTNILLVRLKGIWFWLLSAKDDATNGTAASAVTIGNASVSPNGLFLGSPTSTFVLSNSEDIQWKRPNAAGIAVTAGTQNIKIVNNDAVNSACVLVAGFGATS